MYLAFFDDSADDKRERFVVVGGLISHDLVWNHFDLLWLSATHELKGPFHSTDWEGALASSLTRESGPSQNAIG